MIIIKAPAPAMMLKALELHSPTAAEQFFDDDRIDRVVSPRLSMDVKSSRSMENIQARSSIRRNRQIMFHPSAQRMLLCTHWN